MHTAGEVITSFFINDGGLACDILFNAGGLICGILFHAGGFGCDNIVRLADLAVTLY